MHAEQERSHSEPLCHACPVLGQVADVPAVPLRCTEVVTDTIHIHHLCTEERELT